LDEAKFSRRLFGKSAAATAFSAITHVSGAAAAELSNATDLTAAQIQEVDARFEETLRRYGNRLSEEQRARIRRVLIENERMLAAINDFPLDNADAPAVGLRLRVEDAAATPRQK
jgi:hypothetical protein